MVLLCKACTMSCTCKSFTTSWGHRSDPCIWFERRLMSTEPVHLCNSIQYQCNVQRTIYMQRKYNRWVLSLFIVVLQFNFNGMYIVHWALSLIICAIQFTFNAMYNLQCTCKWNVILCNWWSSLQFDSISMRYTMYMHLKCNWFFKSVHFVAQGSQNFGLFSPIWLFGCSSRGLNNAVLN